MKKYIELKNPGKYATHLRIELFYDLGGYNYFTGRQTPRGYYLSVSPVAREGYMESFTAFSGIKQLVKAVARKSEKAYTTAAESVNDLLPDLIAAVCEKNNIEVVQNG